MRDRLGYFVGTWGNISVRIEGGLLVTPSRMKLEEVVPEALVVAGWEGGVVKGERLPTSETDLHRALLRERQDLGALIHSHSMWASVCACAHETIPVLVDDMAEVIGGEVRCSEYRPAGHHKEVAEAARAAIGPEACAVLLGNHGVVAGGRDLSEAAICAQFVEKAAAIWVLGRALGGVQPIPKPLWREERDRYLYKYGKAADFD
jgi:L-fuculose-phosphate aldolase